MINVLYAEKCNHNLWSVLDSVVPNAGEKHRHDFATRFQFVVLTCVHSRPVVGQSIRQRKFVTVSIHLLAERNPVEVPGWNRDTILRTPFR